METQCIHEDGIHWIVCDGPDTVQVDNGLGRMVWVCKEAAELRNTAGRFEDIGQHMLMLLTREREMLIKCWLCPLQLDDRAAYRRHLAAKHAGPCPRCRRVHTGKCEAEPKPGNAKTTAH